MKMNTILYAALLGLIISVAVRAENSSGGHHQGWKRIAQECPDQMAACKNTKPLMACLATNGCKAALDTYAMRPRPRSPNPLPPSGSN